MADKKKWMQAASDRMKKKGTEGSLRKAAGKKEGTPMSEADLARMEAMAKKMMASKESHARGVAMMKKVVMARNMMKKSKK